MWKHFDCLWSNSHTTVSLEHLKQKANYNEWKHCIYIHKSGVATHIREVIQMPLGNTSEAMHALICNKCIFLFPANILSFHIPVQDYSTPLCE